MKNLQGLPYYVLIGVAFLTLFFCFRNPANPWDRVIQAEGLGYYAYLPSLFIEQDLSWSKTGNAAEIYYGRDIRKDFLNDLEGTKINKYFPGISFLWLPFFLAAHLLSLLFHFPPDGYSLLYQYAIAVAAIFYLTLGMRFCEKLLAELFPETQLHRFSIMVIVLGSNLLYNTIGVASQSHVYSFFLLSAFHFYAIKYLKSPLPEIRHLFLGLLCLSISFCIRPTDILYLLILPFTHYLCSLPLINYSLPFKNRKYFFAALAAIFFPVFITTFLWFLQTGKFIADSYVGEHFYFLNPEVFKFLFSFRKGWLTYHPVFYISLLGLTTLAFKKQWPAFLSGFLFLAVLVYVFSSWWIWTYSVPFGQRVMIDFYPVFIIFFALAIQNTGKVFRRILLLISLFLILFNLWRSYQYHKGILPWEYVNEKVFFSSITDTQPVARYLVNEPRIIDKSVLHLPQLSQAASEDLSKSLKSSGRPLFYSALPAFQVKGIHHIRVNLVVFIAKPAEDIKLDLVIYNRQNEMRRESRYLRDYLRPEKWTDMSFGFELNTNENPDRILLEVFFENASNPVSLKPSEIELITENGIPEFKP